MRALSLCVRVSERMCRVCTLAAEYVLCVSEGGGVHSGLGPREVDQNTLDPPEEQLRRWLQGGSGRSLRQPAGHWGAGGLSTAMSPPSSTMRGGSLST